MNVLIANAFPQFQQAIVSLLRDSFEIGVVGDAKNGADALRLLHSEAWDIAMLSIQLPVGGGLLSLRKFKIERPSLPVVMVRFGHYPLAARACMDAGASGYVIERAFAQELVPSIRAALVGEVYLSAAMSEFLKTH